MHPSQQPCYSLFAKDPTQCCKEKLQLHNDRPGKRSSCTLFEPTAVTSAHVPVVDSASKSSKVSNSVAVAAALAPSCSLVAVKPCRECVMQHMDVVLR
jgi:hypothetical protein